VRAWAWCFQQPNPYPKSIYENIAYGSRIHGLASSRIQESVIIETVLRKVGLWKEVRHRLDKPALQLSQGQQQRLCLARVLAMEPCGHTDGRALRLAGSYIHVPYRATSSKN
jgi:ABC-type phosphate transport system ATPase subunit